MSTIEKKITTSSLNQSQNEANVFIGILKPANTNGSSLPSAGGKGFEPEPNEPPTTTGGTGTR